MQFNFKGFSIECSLIGKEMLFLGSGVTSILGYSNSSRAIKLYTKPHHQRKYSRSGKQGGRPSLFLTLAGVISLALNSSLDSANEFQDWITDNVIPQVILESYYKSPEATKEQRLKSLTEDLEAIVAELPGTTTTDILEDVLRMAFHPEALAF